MLKPPAAPVAGRRLIVDEPQQLDHVANVAVAVDPGAGRGSGSASKVW
jgi:hypothetical protein